MVFHYYFESCGETARVSVVPNVFNERPELAEALKSNLRAKLKSALPFDCRVAAETERLVKVGRHQGCWAVELLLEHDLSEAEAANRLEAAGFRHGLPE